MSFAPKTSTGAPLVPTVSPAIVSPATLSQPAHVDPSPRVDMPPATLPIPDARPSSPPTLTKTEAQEVEAKGKELARREYRTIHNKGTVVGTMPDDELFSMLRRFAVQVQHVRAPAHHHPDDELDLRLTTERDLPFNATLIQSNAERLAMSLGVDILLVLKELDRLSSWSEEDRYRTKVAASSYFIAWILHLTTPLLLILLAVLVAVPSSREFLFPPESTYDPYVSKSEQVEEATKDFFAGVAEFVRRVVLGSVGVTAGGGSDGPQPGGDQSYQDHQAGSSVKDQELKKGKHPEQAKKTDEKVSQSKREELIEKNGRLLQDTLGFVADISEVASNAVSPPSLYPETDARTYLTIIFTILALVTAVTPPALIAHASSAGLGIAFFGRPLLVRAWHQFIYYVPQWRQLADPRNSVFHRVPDNQQLVLWILRGKESDHKPLPLHPELEEEKDNEKTFIEETADERVPFDRDDLRKIEEEEGDRQNGKGKGTISHLLHRQHGRNKETAKHGLRGVLGLESKDVQPKLKYAVKSKLTHSVENALSLADDGDIAAFPAEYHGATGRVTIEYPPGDKPLSETKISFVPDGGPKDADPLLSIDVDSIIELKKGEVMEGKQKLVRSGFELIAGHGLGLQSLLIRTKKPGAGVGFQVDDHVWVTNVEMDDPYEDDPDSWIEFEKVGRRDQLFMRICALGTQVWESY